MDLDQLGRALNAFAALDPVVFPLHHAQLFLEVARRGQCTYAELEEALSLSHGSISRGVTALGETNRRGEPGYRLLTADPDPKESRRFLVRLSPRGRALLRQLQGL